MPSPTTDLLIQQVLINLLENAAKYAPAGSPVEVGAAVDDGALWASNARYCRCASRDYWEPGYRNRTLGFRLVLAVRDNRGIRPFS